MQKGKKGLNDFKFGTFVSHFPSDGVANLVVKGLSSNTHTHKHTDTHTVTHTVKHPPTHTVKYTHTQTHWHSKSKDLLVIGSRETVLSVQSKWQSPVATPLNACQIKSGYKMMHKNNYNHWKIHVHYIFNSTKGTTDTKVTARKMPYR